MTEITERITGSDIDRSTVTGNDPVTQPHTTATLPNSYPSQPNTHLHIAWGILVKINSPGTSSICDRVFCDTTLTNYVTDVPNASQHVFQVWQSMVVNKDADGEIHWSIRLDNPTAPPPPAGAWVQAKQHMDGHLSYGNITSASDIQTPIMLNIPFIKSIAKY